MLKNLENWKSLAITIYITGTVVTVIAAVAVEWDSWIVNILILLLGIMGSWSSAFLVYGIGRLIENTDKLISWHSRTNKSVTRIAPSSIVYDNLSSTANNDIDAHRWRCSKCGNMISEKECPYCKDTREKNDQ